MLTAIIVAAGSSQRMGFDKLFADLAGRPVVAWSVSAFQRCEAVDGIVLVTRPEKEASFRELAQRWDWTKLRAILPGGTQRHLSVWNGLLTVAAGFPDQPERPEQTDEADEADDKNVRAADFSQFVAVHDGARPLVTPDMIERCYDLARDVGAACCAAPVSDTLKRADADRRVCGGVDRANLWAMQTPQTFALPLLMQAYQGIIDAGETVTDETSALESIGQSVALLNSGDFNLKVTFPQDLELARHLLMMR